MKTSSRIDHIYLLYKEVASYVQQMKEIVESFVPLLVDTFPTEGTEISGKLFDFVSPLRRRLVIVMVSLKKVIDEPGAIKEKRIADCFVDFPLLLIELYWKSLKSRHDFWVNTLQTDERMAEFSFDHSVDSKILLPLRLLVSVYKHLHGVLLETGIEFEDSTNLRFLLGRMFPVFKKSFDLVRRNDVKDSTLVYTVAGGDKLPPAERRKSAFRLLGSGEGSLARLRKVVYDFNEHILAYSRSISVFVNTKKIKDCRMFVTTQGLLLYKSDVLCKKNVILCANPENSVFISLREKKGEENSFEIVVKEDENRYVVETSDFDDLWAVLTSESRFITRDSVKKAKEKVRVVSLQEKEQVSPEDLPYAEATDREKRKYTITETIETEAAYLKNLEILFRRFIEPIQEKKIFKEEDFQTIFMSLASIKGVNERLLSELNYDEEKDISNIGEAFVKYVQFFKIYTTYCASHDASMKIVERYMKKSAKLNKLVEDNMYNVPEVKKRTLADFMIEPIQRICKYPLLLKEILKCTSKDHPDYESLAKAYVEIQKVADYVNENKRKIEESAKLYDVYTKLSSSLKDLDIIKPGRRLIKEFTLKKKSRRLIQQRHFWLFTDILVYAKKKKTGGYTYKGYIKLPGAIIKHTFKDPTIFQIIPWEGKKNKAYTFYCESEEEKKELVGLILSLQKEYDENMVNLEM